MAFLLHDWQISEIKATSLSMTGPLRKLTLNAPIGAVCRKTPHVASMTESPQMLKPNHSP
ncbi:hypothetical protein Rcae01_00217 [Novipirellula caenicola]|uniref:Uncharacterized protein n=1 Tax=Novipirellula caenicola TaxID=1536901 RepID=A0ABP9VHU7_9BACT